MSDVLKSEFHDRFGFDNVKLFVGKIIKMKGKKSSFFYSIETMELSIRSQRAEKRVERATQVWLFEQPFIFLLLKKQSIKLVV